MAFAAIEEKIRRNTAQVIEESRRSNISTRAAANALAIRRIRSAEQARRWK